MAARDVGGRDAELAVGVASAGAAPRRSTTGDVLRPVPASRPRVARHRAERSETALAAPVVGVTRPLVAGLAAASRVGAGVARYAGVSSARRSPDAEIAEVALEIQGSCAGARAVVAAIRPRVRFAADVGVADALPVRANGDGLRQKQVEGSFA